MSSDVDDDQVLPESLQKLEIVPVFSHSSLTSKSNSEHNKNPFFSELSSANGLDDRITKDLFGPSCNSCQSTEKSCSVNSMDVGNKNVSNRNWRYHGNNSIEHSINKQIQFKHRHRDKSQLLSDKKLTILREPILRSIGRCVHHHNANKTKSSCEIKTSINHKMAKDELNSASNSAQFGQKSCDHCANGLNSTANRTSSSSRCNIGASTSKCECRPVPEYTNDPNNVIVHGIRNWRLHDEATVDFKSLVNECSNLTLSTHNTADNSIIELHKTRNFQILQANQIGDVDTSSSNEANIPNSSNSSNNLVALATAAATAATSTPGQNVMNCSLSSNSSNSSSCSQQARMNSSNCDVTIDELASYIEFQLHLPKPMSSNVYEAMFS